MRSEVSKVYGRSGPRLQALRKKDPKKNLVERLRLLSKWPNLIAQLHYLDAVMDLGWAVMSVPEDGVAYTIGVKYHLDHPELLIAAPHLTPEQQKRILNQLVGRLLLGEEVRLRKPLTVEGHRLTFQPYRDETFKLLPCGYLARFEELFEDRFHLQGGTLPVIWAVAEPVAKKKASSSRRRKPLN